MIAEETCASHELSSLKIMADIYDPKSQRRRSLFSNTLVLSGFNALEAAKIDESKLGPFEYTFTRKNGHFEGAIFQGADLRKINLENAYLQGASLLQTKLQGAHGTSLTKGSLTGFSRKRSLCVTAPAAMPM